MAIPTLVIFRGGNRHLRNWGMGRNGYLYKHWRLFWVPVLSFRLDSVSRMPSVFILQSTPL